MLEEQRKRETNPQKKSGFEFLMEIFSWIQICASPTIIGVVVAALIYFPHPTDGRLVLAVVVALTGLVIGMVFATRVLKKRGASHFMSRINASPELDNNEDDNN